MNTLSSAVFFSFAAIVATTPVAEPALSDIINNLANGVSATEIQQAILPDFMNWDFSAAYVQKRLGLSDADINNLPVQVLNIPGYANYTDAGWNLRIHGAAYKEPLAATGLVSQKTGDSATNTLLSNHNFGSLSTSEKRQARNLTSTILSIPQSGERLIMDVSIPSPQYSARVQLPTTTDSLGQFDIFDTLPDGNLPDASDSSAITRIELYARSAAMGNTSSYLVPTTGVTVVADVDDVLRETRIFEPTDAIANTFARPYRAWSNMPEIYAGLAEARPPYHFHYLTTTPQQATRLYHQFLAAIYPPGSLDTRPMDFSTLSATFNSRRILLEKVLDTFPSRRFVLVGDTTNSDVMQAYPQLMKTRPHQVFCILLRNTSATDPANRIPYDTSEFRDLPHGGFMFFRTPDDLRGVNFNKGECANANVQQNVTYGWQGLPGGISLLTGVANAMKSEGTKVKDGKVRVWWLLCVAAGAMVWITV